MLILKMVRYFPKLKTDNLLSPEYGSVMNNQEAIYSVINHAVKPFLLQ